LNYFPTRELKRERFAGLTKSLIAVRSAGFSPWMKRGRHVTASALLNGPIEQTGPCWAPRDKRDKSAKCDKGDERRRMIKQALFFYLISRGFSASANLLAVAVLPGSPG